MNRNSVQREDIDLSEEVDKLIREEASIEEIDLMYYEEESNDRLYNNRYSRE